MHRAGESPADRGNRAAGGSPAPTHRDGDVDMQDVLETLKKLPKLCASRLPSTDEPILIRRGVKGYWKAPRRDLDVDRFNARHGVTKGQEAAMLIGSMYGWEVPGADPDIWDAETGDPV